MDDDEIIEEESEKWSPAEIEILMPALGLIKTSSVALKKIQTSLKSKGDPWNVQHMDQVLSHCQKISAGVDDLAMPLYPAMNVQEVQIESENLAQSVTLMIESLKDAHFVSNEDFETLKTFILKAVEHNMGKLTVALASDQLKNLEMK